VTIFSETPSQVLAKLIFDRRPRPQVGEYVLPQGDLEAELSNLWAEVLRIDRIGRNDNIFDLGGDSLHMTQIASRIWKMYKVRLPLEMLFEHPTIAELAIAVTTAIGPPE
jgi:acyl carrier protein